MTIAEIVDPNLVGGAHYMECKITDEHGRTWTSIDEHGLSCMKRSYVQGSYN